MSKDVHHPHRRWPRRSAASALVVLPVLVLAACGGSSSTTGTTNTTTAAASNSASATPQTAGRSGRFAAARACLQKQGIALPTPSGTPGQAPGAAAGGPTPPEGVSRTKFREALAKCGLNGSFRGRGGGARFLSSAAGRAALAKYATCMRENGVQLPAPNTTGKGPVFNTKGIDTTSQAFKSAQQKCRSDLPGPFGGRARGTGPAPTA
jgi:hypothetical protein